MNGSPGNGEENYGIIGATTENRNGNPQERSRGTVLLTNFRYLRFTLLLKWKLTHPTPVT